MIIQGGLYTVTGGVISAFATVNEQGLLTAVSVMVPAKAKVLINADIDGQLFKLEKTTDTERLSSFDLSPPVNPGNTISMSVKDLVVG